MRHKQFWYCALLLLLFYPFATFANIDKSPSAPQPTACINATFSKTGTDNWSTVSLQLKNNCGQTVDFQNVNVTFNNATNLNTSFWGNFGPLTYPDNVLQITSTPTNGIYLASFSLHFPEGPWSNSKLPAGQSITIIYGIDKPAYDPNSVKVYLNQAPPANTGAINLKNGPLPTALQGYTGNPTVTLTQTDNGTTTGKILPWNTTTTVDQLANNKIFNFATPDIVFNGYRCTANFSPTSATSNNTTPPTVNLAYSCVVISQVNVNLSVSGLTSATTNVTVTMTPPSGSAINKQVNLTNGRGTAAVTLTQGTVYNVSATNITGYSASFNPQPFTATSNATETITYAPLPPQTGGRLITYIPGWKQPPTATELKNAGYTHVMIAFGVFSTTSPGVIVPAFDTVTKSYIDSLHSAGIKALLSLGGALTNLPNTSVDFHQVLTMSGSPTQFQTTFVQSLKSLISQYGFDGFDIDIEHGVNGTGSFQNPTGDIAVLAKIINQMHTDLPSLLITLTPQTANIGATSNFDGTWGNYSSLIMQTYNALSWVGIQLYNTGCILGIDQVCYDPNATNTPNFSVAMAVDLLANWPATDSAGRPTGFQPYISHLRADQVVLGYPAPNAQGASDGSPVTPTTTIKRAIQCLKTASASGTSCGTYVPPKAYGLIGGAFNWEVTYDQNNQYKFATDLKNCVSTGACG